MAKITKVQRWGIAVALISIFGGMAGALASIYMSFAALERAENAGLGPVADHIDNAIIFIALGALGTVTGVAMLIMGRAKPEED